MSPLQSSKWLTASASRADVYKRQAQKRPEKPSRETEAGVSLAAAGDKGARKGQQKRRGDRKPRHRSRP